MYYDVNKNSFSSHLSHTVSESTKERQMDDLARRIQKGKNADENIVPIIKRRNSKKILKKSSKSKCLMGCIARIGLQDCINLDCWLDQIKTICNA